jgi:glycosyltransferase involved in cell wall biosynthesis
MSTRPDRAAISVIVPCRNAADVVGHQLEALARQSCARPWEVVVVDNGSSDGTRQVVERFRGRLQRLVVMDARGQRSAAHARNVGARAAEGENVAFCDADDEVSDGWLASVDAALREHRAIAFKTDTAKLNGGNVARESRKVDGLQQYTYPPYLPYSGATIAVRRDLFLALGGFDETMLACEDADFCWRLQHAGVPLHFVGDAVIHVRLRPTLRAMCRQARLWGEYNVVLYKKFRPLGMPPLGRIQGLRNLIGTARRFPRLMNRRTRSSWLWDANWAAGRLIGSLKHGVWAL